MKCGQTVAWARCPGDSGSGSGSTWQWQVAAGDRDEPLPLPPGGPILRWRLFFACLAFKQGLGFKV